MEILKHPKLPLYLLFSFLILLTGIGISIIINPPTITHNFTFINSPVYTMSSFEIFTSVIIKNLLATFIIMSLGILGLRFIPATCILINGYTLGYTISLLNYNSVTIFATIFPHGYFEFPLLLFTGACSFIVIDEVKKTRLNAVTLLTKHGNSTIKYALKNYLFYPYILIIIPGVFITAVLEATFSLWNLRVLLGV
jgi:uncharacterized membrane protein SpoIIM required for sporulation